MHRATLIALVAAAVVGIVAGSVVAIQRSTSGRASGVPSAPSTTQTAPTTGTPSSGSTSEPSPTATATDEPGPGALLYADRRKIYDGRLSVSYDVPPDLPTSLRRPDRLIRIDGGYLLTFVTSTEEASSLLL